MGTITPYQLNEYTVQLTDIYAELEQDIFMEMVNLLITEPSKNRDYAIQWQVEKLRQTRQLNDYTIDRLSQAVGLANQELNEIFQAVGVDTVETVDGQLEVRGLNRIPLSTEFDTLLTGFVQQTRDGIDNFVNSKLIDRQGIDGTVVRTYKRVIESTVAKVVVGEQTINQALTRAVIEARDRGLPSGFTRSDGRTIGIQEYLDSTIRTTVNNTYNEVKEQRQREYGIHLVVVDYYSGARPACAPIQGKVCSYRGPAEDTEGYPSIYEFGYGKPSGIRGVNCRHSLIPFVEGVNTNNFNPPDVSEANAYYKQQQKQRSLEREIRKAKRNLQLVEQINDPEAVRRAKDLVRNRQNRIREYTEENGLPRRYDRERII